jgi:hypothetical protein
MAVGNSSNAIYYSISDGKVSRQFKEPTPNSKERVNKNGRTVFEEFYDYIDGTITAISTKESEYGKFWMITLSDGEHNQVLQFNYSSGYANAFLKCLPNIDIQARVKIIPSLKMEGDKKKATLFVTQHGQPVKWFYTKDNPNGLPQLKQIKVKGKVTWDDSDSMEFLEKMVMTEIVPRLPKGDSVTAASDVEPEETMEDAPF